MPCTINDFRLLLAEAGRLYEKHETGRPKPFNVFSVLRSTHDEVNLHSRFLHALLSYRNPHAATRDNLEDFLCAVGIDGLDEDHAIVERERDNVDILIRDPRAKQSVVIENKIWAADQPEQLLRYAEDQLKAGYKKAHLLYLTLDGHEPEEHSKGDLDVRCISYRDDIRPWLERCQKRAFDEPELRESIAQYRHLVGQLTGTNMSKAYLTELRDLCLKEENLVLVHDLTSAITEARILLLEKLWHEIEDRIKKTTDLPDSGEPTDITRGRIRRFVTFKRNYKWHGLYFPFSPGAKLGIEVDHHIFFGVNCWQASDPDEYNKIRHQLEGFAGGAKNNKWPWLCWKPTDLNPNLRHPNREHLELLANEQTRAEYVEELACGVGKIWEEIKNKGLVSLPEAGCPVNARQEVA